MEKINKSEVKSKRQRVKARKLKNENPSEPVEEEKKKLIVTYSNKDEIDCTLFKKYIDSFEKFRKDMDLDSNFDNPKEGLVEVRRAWESFIKTIRDFKEGREHKLKIKIEMLCALLIKFSNQFSCKQVVQEEETQEELFDW